MLTDAYNRTFQYLRLSVTDACNFKCAYCLPNGFRPAARAEPPLTLDEIKRLAKAFSSLGFTKVRLTGGEPTIRSDIVDIVGIMKEFFTTVALSTNGYRLHWLVPALRSAGLSAVNISFDSLSEERFNRITGRPIFQNVKMGIDSISDAGFAEVKLNAVLLRHTWQQELDLFLNWIRNRNLSVRFIELMETPTTRDFFKENHVSVQHLKSYLLEQGWSERTRDAAAGPAREYVHPAFKGRVGLIAPYATDFCQSCNRLRVSSRGALKLCLFGERDIPLRADLQSDDSFARLTHRIEQLIATKPPAHRLLQGQFGALRSLSQIGG